MKNNPKMHLLNLFAYKDAMANNLLFEIISIGYAEITLHLLGKKNKDAIWEKKENPFRVANK